MSVQSYEASYTTVVGTLPDEKPPVGSRRESGSNFVPLDVSALNPQETTIGLINQIGQQSIEQVVGNALNQHGLPEVHFPQTVQLNSTQEEKEIVHNSGPPSESFSPALIFEKTIVASNASHNVLSPAKTVNNEAVYNAEWDGRTSLQEAVIATVDTVNGTRNAMSIVGTAAAFPSLVSMAKASLITGVTIAAASFMYLLTGVMTTVICIASLIPLGLEELKNSSKELKAAVDSKIQERIKDATEALQEAKLCLANFIGALFMGISQIVVGAVNVCTTPLLTKALHIPAFSSASLKVALVAGSSYGLGGVYVVRGLIQTYRAVRNLNRVNHFSDQFKNCLTHENTDLDRSIGFLNEKQEIGNAYWGRRVDSSCLKEKDVTVLSTDEEKIRHLQEVDKGIYSLQLKNRISLFVAAAMIIGGVITIVVTALTGGIAPLICALVCLVAFTCMEYVFLTSDITSLYNWLLDRTYVQSRELTQFLKKLEEPNLILVEQPNPVLEDVGT